MRSPLLAAAALTAAAASIPAQDWTALVARQWPGQAIRKISEKDFEALVARHLGRLGKDGAYEAFLLAQHRAYGLVPNTLWPMAFAVPSRDLKLAPRDGRLDGLVAEGPEPNGDPNLGGTPTPMACGDQADGMIGSGGDEDWYRFTTSSLSTVQVMTGPGLTGSGLPGAVGDTVLEIYDASSNLVAFNDDHANPFRNGGVRGTYSFCEVELPAGTYFASVRAYSTSQTGSYSMDLRCTQPLQIVPEGPEPNDDPSLGGTPTMIAIGQQGEGATGPTLGDHDWWQFAVVQPTSILIEVGPSMQGGPAIVDSTVTLWDAFGTNLASDDDSGYNAYSQLPFTVQPGTYYVDVGGYNGRAGAYRLLLEQIAIPVNPVAEAAEPNGDPRNGGNPTPIGCGQTGTGEVLGQGGGPPGGDDDWWAFTVTREGWITVRTLPDTATVTGFGPIGDTELWIHDAQYNQRAYDDDGNTGLFSEASAWLEPGSYFARVEGYGTANVGTYYVTVSCDGGGAPGFVTFADGCAGTSGRAPTVSTRDHELALLGTTFVLDFVDLPPSATFFPFLGFSRTQTSAGLPLPVNLAVIGAPGCFVTSDPLAALTLQASPLGTGAVALEVPLTVGLTGAVLFAQAVVLDPGANALGITTSDGAAVIVGNEF